VKLLITMLTMTFVSFGANAGYMVLDQVRGFTCENWIIFDRCKYIDIYAADDQNGKLFTLQKYFKDVDEYKKIKDYYFCNIRTSPNNTDTLGKVISFFKKKINGNNFYTKDKDGKFEMVNIEHLSFKCLKSPEK
jgi:hypothetical protein